MALFGKLGHRGPYKKGEVKIEYTKALMIMEVIGLVMLMILVAYTAFRYSMLPGEIPTHYGVTGEVDGWGSKNRVWVVPVASILIYVIVTLAAFFPNAWNYPVKIPLEKLPQAENKIRQMLMLMKLLVTGLFMYLQFETLQLSNQVSMGVTFGFMILLFLILIYFMGALKRLARGKDRLLP